MTLLASDLLDALRRWPLWLLLGWKDIRARYRRTLIGPFWSALSAAIFIFSLGIIYGALWQTDIATYLPYFSAGYVAWFFFNSCVLESCTAFVAHSTTLTSVRIPYSVFILRLLTRNAVVFAHNLIIHAVVVLFFAVPVGATLVLLVPGLVLFCVNVAWMAMLLAVICTRFRDVTPLVASAMQILFFLTPVFWQPHQFVTAPVIGVVLSDANPAFHLVEVLRAPLLGGAPGWLTYVYLVVLAAVGWFVTTALLRRFYTRIAYWL